MTIKSSSQVSIALLGATATLGCWLLWKALSPVSNNHGGESTIMPPRPRSESKFDFLEEECKMEEEGENQSSTSTMDSSTSTLNEDDLEQIWVHNAKSGTRDVDLKLLQHLVQEKLDRLKKRNKAPRPGGKLSLVSHLVENLEPIRIHHMRVAEREEECKSSEDYPSPHIATVSSPEKAMMSSAVEKDGSATQVKLVVQRYRGATIMIGEEEIVKVGAESSCLTSNPSDANTCGMLVYVSFGEGCTQQSCQAAAKIIVNLPILTLGVWGDGGKTTNLFGMATKQSNASSLIIVPQANLICKVKNKGKNIQYHSQIDKTEGQAMYHYFVNYIRGLILEKQCEERNEPLPEWYQKSCSAQSGKTCSERASPSIPSQDLFRDPSLYQTFDENGIPLTDAQGELITKSAQKKLRKAQAAHKIRHLRYLREQPKSPTTSLQGPPYAWSPVPKEVVPITQHKEENWSNAIDPSFVHVVAGTYSKRQALEYSSDLGPFCHVIQV